MGQRLTALVQGCTDLPLLDYVIDTLPKDLPPQVVSHQSASYLQQPLLAAMQRKCELLGEPYQELTKYFQQEEFTQFQRESNSLAREQIQSLRSLSREKREVLHRHLRDPETAVRLLAIVAVDLGHRHLESDLIERLKDQDAIVRQAARSTLTHLARGTDFGPSPGASQTGIERSIDKWRHWLELQQNESPETPDKKAAIAAKRPKIVPLDIVPLVLESSERAAPPSALDELVQAKGDELRAALVRLRDGKDDENTLLLARAIPKLNGDRQHQARSALKERLTRLSAAALRDKLQDDNIEVRCAAALACGRKKVEEHVGDLLRLLDDREMKVVQSVRAALTELSGEDFGPPSDAGDRHRADCIAAWRNWWKQRRDKMP